MEKGLVYVADDEKDIGDLIKNFLDSAGYRVEVFLKGEDLYTRFQEKPADLLIIDVMMPGIDGFSLTAQIREKSDVPILLLTAKDTDADYIQGFTAGCDDYFTKPFSLIKLMMRVNAIFKRQDKDKKERDILTCGNLSLEKDQTICTIGDQEIRLTKTEASFLYILLEHKDEAVSREDLLRDIWGYGAGVETRVTDDTVKRLRKKLKDHNCQATIETLWGFGFRIHEGEGQ